MIKFKLAALFVLFLSGYIASGQEKSDAEAWKTQDWAFLSKYRAENEKIGAPRRGEKRVIFMGNSITEGWKVAVPDFFEKDGHVNRGIGGQTTPQMLIRFRSDVIDLQPAVVVILVGTNDIAGNTGYSSLKMIEDNIASMVELAKANGIEVILSSVLPAYEFPWRKEVKPIEKIAELNVWIKDYAKANGFIYLDYYSAMVNERNGLKSAYSEDGVHPNRTGYAVMRELAEKAIVRALK